LFVVNTAMAEMENRDNDDGDVEEKRSGVKLLRSMLNKNIKMKMSDGRILVGIFLCTDRAGNVIIGSCNEYTTDPDAEDACEEPRVLGLAMVPGQHICQIFIDDTTSSTRHTASPVGHLTREIDCDDVL